MNTLWYLIKLYGVQIRNNWVRETVYRSNFLTSTLVDCIWVAVEISLFSILYAHIPVLAGWTQPQIFFFLGVFFTSDALFTTCFSRNFWMFSDLVNRGELDILLTKPAPALFLALTRWINITAALNLLIGIAIMKIYAHAAGFAGGWHWGIVFFWTLTGLATQVLLRFLFSIWVFWTDRGHSLARLYYQFFSLATKPDTLYPKWVRFIILTFLPFAFIGSVPARALIHGLAPLEYFQVAAVLLTLVLVSSGLWRVALRRYQSASS